MLFAGVQIERDRRRKCIFLHKCVYATKIVQKFGMANAKHVSVPIDPNVILYPVCEEEKAQNNVPYREAIG